MLCWPVSASQEMHFCKCSSLEERTSWADRDRTVQHLAAMLGVVDLFLNTEIALQDGHVMLYDTSCQLLTSAYKAGISCISCAYDAVAEEPVCRRGIRCCPSMHGSMLHDNTAALQLLHTFRLVQSGTTLAGSIRQFWLFVFQLLWGEGRRGVCIVLCAIVVEDEAARKGGQVWILAPKLHAVNVQICMSNLRVLDSCRDS